MMTRFECAICAGKVSVRNDICSKCTKQYKALYGDNWTQLNWVKALTKNKHYMQKLEKQEEADFTPIGTTYSMSHYYLQENDDITDLRGRRTNVTGTGNHYVIHTKFLDSRKYDTDISKYMRQGMGYRRIHKKLVEEYGADNVPSDRTVWMRTQEFRGK